MFNGTSLPWSVPFFFLVLSLFIITFKYSKALGNVRPPVIRRIELVIWRELLRIARGITTVQAAGVVIVQAIDEIGDVDEAIRHWFMVGTSIVNAGLHSIFNWFLEGPPKEHIDAHLCSLEVDAKSVSPNWPLASLILPPFQPVLAQTLTSHHPLPELPNGRFLLHISVVCIEEQFVAGAAASTSAPLTDTSKDIFFQEDLPVGVRPKRQTANYSNIFPPSEVTAVGSRPNKRKSKAKSLASQSKLARSMSLDNSTLFQGPRYVPIMIGQTYIKTEDIDLEVLKVLP